MTKKKLTPKERREAFLKVTEKSGLESSYADKIRAQRKPGKLYSEMTEEERRSAYESLMKDRSTRRKQIARGLTDKEISKEVRSRLKSLVETTLSGELDDGTGPEDVRLDVMADFGIDPDRATKIVDSEVSKLIKKLK